MNLIIHPEVEKLKEELSNLIFEYDSLTKHVCPQIERNYVLEFGLFEYRLGELELEIKKLKRKKTLMQIEINHENEINHEKIDEKLSREFKEYENKLQAQIDEIEVLEKNKGNEMSHDDFKLLKKTYRKLIKKLHPDLNKNQTFFESKLFIKATECFENGDLKGLQSVTAILPDENIEEVSEVDTLKKLIKDFKTKIDDVKNDYPYNKKDLLENKKSMNNYKEELVGLINDRETYIEKLKKKINEMI